MKPLLSYIFGMLILTLPASGFCNRGMPIGPADNINGYIYAGASYLDPIIGAAGGEFRVVEDASGANSSGELYYGGGNSNDVSFMKIDPSIKSQSNELKSGFSGRIGYDTGLGIAIEIEGSYLSMDTLLGKNFGDYDVMALRAGSYLDPTKGVLPADLANVVYPLDSKRIGFKTKLGFGTPSTFYGIAGNVLISSENVISPYAGGGFGISRLNMFGKEFNKTFYNVMIGALYRIGGGLELTVGYRMTGFIDSAFGGFQPVYPINAYTAYDKTTQIGNPVITKEIVASSTASINSSLMFHRLELGIKVRFQS